MFRVAHACVRLPRPWWWFAAPYLIFYRLGVEWFLGCEIPPRTKIGPGLVVYHGQGLVINDHTVIGKNCVLRHAVTLGNKEDRNGLRSGSPLIGDNVHFGAGAIVIGEIRIEDDATIGAGAVVTKNVAAGSTVVGNPARVVADSKSSPQSRVIVKST
jgi:putative colanic acid biosynthesis acetyltransferase WcaB